MDELEKYVYRELKIDGIETYLICHDHFPTVIELLKLHSSSLLLLEIVKKIKSVTLYPAIIRIPRLQEKYRWAPILCYDNGQNLYHIHYHDGWMCRECGTNNGPVIMPLSEAETSYYGFPLPQISEIFSKVNCRKCGKELQNHIILLDETK